MKCLITCNGVWGHCVGSEKKTIANTGHGGKQNDRLVSLKLAELRLTALFLGCILVFPEPPGTTASSFRLRWRWLGYGWRCSGHNVCTVQQRQHFGALHRLGIVRCEFRGWDILQVPGRLACSDLLLALVSKSAPGCTLHLEDGCKSGRASWARLGWAWSAGAFIGGRKGGDHHITQAGQQNSECRWTLFI